MSEGDYIIREVRTRQHPTLGDIKIWQHNPKFLFDEELEMFHKAGPDAQYICADCIVDEKRLMTTWMVARVDSEEKALEVDNVLIKALELTANENH